MVDPGNYGGRSNLGEALTYLLNTLNPKTTLFIISDFIGLDEDWADSLKMLAAKLQHVVCMMVRDERDSYIQDGVGYIRLADPFTNKVMIVDLSNAKKKFERAVQKQEKAIEDEAQGGRCGFVKTHTNKSFVEPLLKFLEMEESW